MRYLVTVLLCFALGLPALQGQSLFRGTTRAVVIGVSEYRDDAIEDLNFAHRDAQAFADFLRSNAGGNVPNENITVLTNDSAKAKIIYGALKWLMRESRKGDRAIIYFSGHGDIDVYSPSKEGFLLAYDSDPQDYQLTACEIDYVKEIVGAMSDTVEVIMITDACRAGNVGGADHKGAQAATSVLKERFGNEVKILSCQPDQLSYEGTMWGEGRGLFSYYLVNGLYGAADVDEDGTVNLLEIRRYLEEKLFFENEKQQIPLTNGDNLKILSTVDMATGNDGNHLPSMGFGGQSPPADVTVTVYNARTNYPLEAVVIKLHSGEGEGARQQVSDENGQAVFSDLDPGKEYFISAESGSRFAAGEPISFYPENTTTGSMKIFLQERTQGQSGNLEHEPIIEHDKYQVDLDDVQMDKNEPPMPVDLRSLRLKEGGMNAITGVNDLTEEQWDYLIEYDLALKYKNYLDASGRSAIDYLDKMKASDIPAKIIENETQRLVTALRQESQEAITAYLNGELFSRTNERENMELAGQIAEYLSIVTELTGDGDYFYDRTSAEMYFFQALKKSLQANIEQWRAGPLIVEGLGYCDKSLEFDQSLSITYNQMGMLYAQAGMYPDAEHKFKEANYYNPNWLIPLSNLACIHILNGNKKDAAAIIGGLRSKGTIEPALLVAIGKAYSAIDSIHQAIAFLQEATTREPDNIDALNGLGEIYQYSTGNLSAAELHYNLALSSKPEDYWSNVNLARLFLDQNDYTRSETCLTTAMEYHDQDALLHQLLGNVYLFQDRFDSALAEYEFAVQTDPFNPAGYVGKALHYSALGEKKESLEELEKAVELGYREFAQIENLSVFQETADSRKYKKLKKKYTKQ